MSEEQKRYGVIYSDPPWHFKVYDDETGSDRGAIAHYDTMSFEQIAAIPVTNWAAEDCVLFLWATDPLLPKALELISLWGFEYKTVGFYWAKTNKDEKTFFTGMGYWTRANPEQCLLATRGKPKRLNADVQRLIVAPRREHSRKPDEVRSAIERLVPGPYLEMFARETKPGWDVFGNQTQLFTEALRAPLKTKRTQNGKKLLNLDDLDL